MVLQRKTSFLRESLSWYIIINTTFCPILNYQIGFAEMNFYPISIDPLCHVSDLALRVSLNFTVRRVIFGLIWLVLLRLYASHRTCLCDPSLRLIHFLETGVRNLSSAASSWVQSCVWEFRGFFILFIAIQRPSPRYFAGKFACISVT